jgi:hypothetical protein
MKNCNVLKTLCCLFLGCNISHAQTYKFEITCTASARYYCSVKSGCVINRDANPSVFKVKVNNSKSIEIKKYVGSNQPSIWTAKAHSLDGSDKYQFIEDGILTVFNITNDRKKFVYMMDDGIGLYNSDLSLNKKPNDDLGGQIETGSCISN